MSARPRGLVLLFFPVLLVPSLELSAQVRADSAALAAGARVRITRASGEPSRFTGTLVEAVGDTLRVQPDGLTSQAFPKRDVVRVEISQGRKSQWRLGAVAGVLLGTGIAVALVQGKTYDLGDSTPEVLYLAVPAIGGVVGGAVGASIHTEQWQTVPWSKPPRPGD